MDAWIKLSRMEDICSGLSLRSLVFCKDRRSSESDIVGIFEMLSDLCVHLPKLGAVAFVDNEHALLFLEGIHNARVLFRTECRCHFLNGGDNQGFRGILQCFHQAAGAVGRIYAVFFKAVIFIHRLIIKVLPVNEEEYLINSSVIPQQRGKLEGRKRFSGSGCVKHKAVHIGHDNPVIGPFHCINLVRPHDKKYRLRILNDEEFIQHFRQVNFLQKAVGKIHELIDAHVIFIGPKEGQGLQNILLLSKLIVLVDVRTVFCHR